MGNLTMKLSKNIRVLKGKEVKLIMQMIERQWGYKKKPDHHFLEHKDGTICIVNKEVSEFELDKVRINSIGLDIARKQNDKLVLSIEGAQMIGPNAKRNLIELNYKLARLWMKGYDIPFDEEEGKKLKGFQILKNNNDYLGCGIFKENRIINFMPKARILVVND